MLRVFNQLLFYYFRYPTEKNNMMNNTYDDYTLYNETLNNGSTDYYYDYILDEEGNKICEEVTEEEKEFYRNFAWWMEGVGQMTVGGIGFLG